jgi:hypothetical protein
MVRDGQLVQNRRGGFAPIQTLNLVTGVVIANPEGSASCARSRAATTCSCRRMKCAR